MNRPPLTDDAEQALIDRVDALLPQTQCGQCTFAGCRPYATAVVRGDADINQCPPGGHATAASLAALLARPAKPVDPRFGDPLAPTLVAYTTWTLGRIDQAAAYEFWIDAAEKVGLVAGDPVIALTNRFAEARRNRERMATDVQLSAIYRAWNARRAGQPLRMLKTRSPSGGLVPIPEPR